MELWRISFVHKEGGAEEVEIANLGALEECLHCQHVHDLAQYLDELLSSVLEQCRDLPRRHLTTLLLSMLPIEVYNDVTSMKLRNPPWQGEAEDHPMVMREDAMPLELAHLVGRNLPKMSAYGPCTRTPPRSSNRNGR